MPRNIERDTQRELERRRKLIESGFALFSKRGIEMVTLQEIADDAQVGIATLYKYYENKVNLVIAISAYVWKKIWADHDKDLGYDVIKTLNAYQSIEAFFNLIISLYKEHPEVLRFSGYYKTYMNNENAGDISENAHLQVLEPINDIFHELYEKAKTDKSIRTDIDEHQMFTALAINMLGAAERYALGIVWAGHDDNDYTEELVILKDMMLNWLKLN